MVYQEMAATSPDRYRPNLTRSLARLARIYEELGQTANAASVRTELAEVADTNQ